MADDEVTGTAPAGEASPKVENVAVQETTSAPLVASNGDQPPTPEQEAEPEAPPADEPTLTPEQKRLKQAEWNAKQNRFEASQAKKRVAELEAENAALKAPKTVASPTPTAADAANTTANAPAGGYGSKAEFDAAVQETANQRARDEAQAAANKKFNDACDEVFNKGVDAHKDEFKQAVANLQSVGVMNREVLDLILETEDPVKVLFDLGADPDKAAALLEMTPAKRAIEITKLSVMTPKKTPDPLSNAPAPVRTVEGSARVMGEPKDDDDDAAWFAKRQAQRRERMRA